MIKDIELNPQFRKALELMENTGNNVFITGKAGTEKATLLEYFRSITTKNIVVLAPTGVAVELKRLSLLNGMFTGFHGT